MRLHVVGFGSLNLDEFWEVSADFLREYGLRTGEEYVRDVDWFNHVYPDLAQRGSLKASDPGGSAANTVAAVYKMGFQTGFFGATGRRDMGQIRLNELGSDDNLRILLTETPAGRCLALINREDPTRDRALIILSNANDLAGSGGIELAYFESYDWVHMTSFVSKGPLRAQIELAQNLSSSTSLSFDPGPIYCSLGLDELRQILLRTQILFTTQEELQLLTTKHRYATTVNRVLDLGITTLVVKMGSKGLQAFSQGRVVHQPAIVPSQIVDRTGAGDVAAAGFLAGTINNCGIEECLELAVMAASRSIGGYGRSTYPDKFFLNDLLQRRSKSL